MGIFKAYDIRGKYPGELNESMARNIGQAIGRFFISRGKLTNPNVVIGRDVRASSPVLAKNAIDGLLNAGCKITDVGIISTPMSYFACGHYNFDGSIMVTASHNPAEYNGFKVCREKAIALSETTGLKEIENIFNRSAGQSASQPVGQPTRIDIRPDYKKFILGFVNVKRPLKVVIDTANGVMGPVLNDIFGNNSPFKIIPMFFEPDGRFPNHEPNPMHDENIEQLRQAVTAHQADLGVAFDGDGDRCIFLTERGVRVPNDIITALIGRQILSREKGAHILYDLRSSWVVKEEVNRLGGRPVRERVGHAFIKETMRRLDIPFGGELSGHYYFRDNYFADCGLIAFINCINLLSGQELTFSELVKPLQKYHASGELNFTVVDKDKKIAELVGRFKDGKQDMLDGITVEYADWWFNVRKSNTEPLLRLNIEARTVQLLDQVRQKVISVIKD
ncbi:MAG: phosphomannomutase/phosphoglucomutase [Candidatus Paceibacterota bacterium]